MHSLLSTALSALWGADLVRRCGPRDARGKGVLPSLCPRHACVETLLLLRIRVVSHKLGCNLEFPPYPFDGITAPEPTNACVLAVKVDPVTANRDAVVAAALQTLLLQKEQ